MIARLKVFNFKDLVVGINKFNLFISGNLYLFNGISLLGQSQIILKLNSILFTLIDNNNFFFSNRKKRVIFGYFKTTALQIVRGFFLEIIFFGINYNFKRSRKKTWRGYPKNKKMRTIDMELLFAKKLRMRIPQFMAFKVFKRRIIVFSFFRSKILNFFNMLKKLRMPSPYTGKGIRIRRRNIHYKIGKKRIK